MFSASVITISDKCYAGLREDASGPLVKQLLTEAGFDVQKTALVPDERKQIEAELIRHADGYNISLVLTTGGTGFSPRDITPEATAAVCERMAPGIPEAMRVAGMKLTNRGMLTRAVAGIRGNTLIINLPGTPKAAGENLEAVLPGLAHGLEMLLGIKGECAGGSK